MNSVRFNKRIYSNIDQLTTRKIAVGLFLWGLFVCSTVMAKQAGMEKISKDVKIFSKVLMSVLAEEKNVKSTNHFSSYNDRNSGGIYLQGQGVFYAVDLRQARHFFSDNMDFDFSDMESILEEEESILENSEELNELGNIELEAITDVANIAQIAGRDWDDYRGNYGKALASDRQKIKEQNKKVREVRAKLKSLQKNKEKSRAELKAVRKELELTRSKLEKSRKKYQKKRANIKKQDVKTRNEEAKKLESKVVTAVCDYGSLLKSIPNDEKLNILLRDYHRDEQGTYADKVYIFHKEDIKACMNDKLTAEKLQEKAISYLY